MDGFERRDALRRRSPIQAGIGILRVLQLGASIHYEAASNGAGDYYFPNLLPGTYRLEADKPGFTEVIKPDVVLHVQDSVEINFELPVGSAATSVTVSGGEPLVQLVTSDLGTV